MRHALLAGAAAALLSGCAGFLGRDEAAVEFEKETRAAETKIKEEKVRSNLSKLESSLADYAKAEKRIPSKLSFLIPKYLAEMPLLDIPACGRETDRVEIYSPEVLRGGQVDGTRIKGTGRWGYVYNQRQVVIFVDCLKPSSRGAPSSGKRRFTVRPTAFMTTLSIYVVPPS